ncbi:MAG: hypothetical protein DSY90_09370 [Deltaproteobacteria bacterium]|nr:MAG: hypothetical protein DSY90_09370 [Deltaproteobacteria bacterium]
MRKKDTLFNRIKDKYRKPVTLTGRHYQIAKKMMLDTTEIMNRHDIDYFLDAGTLLGMIRDGDLIPWDHDIDMLLPLSEVDKFKSIVPALQDKNWRVKTDYPMHHDGPCWKKGAQCNFRMYNNRFYHFGRGRIKLEIYVLYPDGDHCWYHAMGKNWKLPAVHFKTHAIHIFDGHALRIPARAEAYLDYIYADWKTPTPAFNHLSGDHSIYNTANIWNE